VSGSGNKLIAPSKQNVQDGSVSKCRTQFTVDAKTAESICFGLNPVSVVDAYVDADGVLLISGSRK
jgi:hypothetical protein